MQKFLNGLERIGNKLPHPFFLFLWLAIIVAVVSCIMSLIGVTVTNPKTQVVVGVKNLLSSAGLEYVLGSMVSNFINFPPLGLIIVVMFGIGLADKVGMIGNLIHYTVAKAPPSMLTFVVFIVGISGSIASDANYLILIPLVAMIYHSLGRHPLAGAAAAYGAAGAGFDISLFVTGTDVTLAGLSTSAAQLINPQAEITPLDNYYFTAASVPLLAIVGTILIDKVIEPRLKRTISIDESLVQKPDMREVSAQEQKALKMTGYAALAFIAVFALILLPQNSPLRNENGGLLPSPFLKSLVPVIFLFFITVGITYGRVAGTLKTMRDIPAKMSEAVREMAPTLTLFFVISQFIAYFRWTGLGEVIAVSGSIFLEHTGFTGLPLVVTFIIMTAALNIFMTSGSAQWSLMSPIFVPMLMMIGFEAAFVQAMFRIGDSVTNIISPMSPYFAVCLANMQRYRPDLGIGTLMATMLPISIGFLICWTAFLLLWLLIGLPIGPGVYMMTSSA